MKLNQITEKSDKELQSLVVEQRQALANQVVEFRTKKVSNVKQIKAIKQTIARALTIARQRELTKTETGE